MRALKAIETLIDMCNFTDTHYTTCGCTVSQQTGLCGYQDEDFAECQRLTEFEEATAHDGECGRDECENRRWV